MRINVIYLIVLFVLIVIPNVSAQKFDWKREINILELSKEDIRNNEKEQLKKEVIEIERRLKSKEIGAEGVDQLKNAAAKRHALNIENRIAIVDAQIALLERNKDYESIEEYQKGKSASRVKFGPWIDISTDDWKKKKNLKYDRRTYSDFVMAIGLNNALIEGQSINESPYKIGGSRFFEMGWVWRSRVFDNTNFLRINYGFSFQFNGLKPKANQYFAADNGMVELQEFEYDLKKSKLRMDNLVFPVHLEFGPSKLRKTENSIRYSLRNQFRLGIGAYGGFNMGTRQKLKYNRNGDNVKDKLKRGYNTNELVYGLSAYVGFDGTLLYMKYDLNPIFKDAPIEQNNISLGLRFDL